LSQEYKYTLNKGDDDGDDDNNNNNIIRTATNREGTVVFKVFFEAVSELKNVSERTFFLSAFYCLKFPLSDPVVLLCSSHLATPLIPYLY